jgi:hypothetical protein
MTENRSILAKCEKEGKKFDEKTQKWLSVMDEWKSTCVKQLVDVIR